MQGTSKRSHSELLRALNNAADESFQLARRVKIDEKKTLSDLPLVARRGSRYTILVK